VPTSGIPVPQRNEALVRALAEIVYEGCASTGEWHWDGDFTRLLGYSAGEIGSEQGSWRSRVHPDDLEAALAEFDKAARERRPHDVEYRFRHRHGHYLWLRDRGVSLLSSLQNPSPETAESIREIAEGAQRAANLTRQLLAFSRKQVMQARDLNLNEVIANFSRMLVRTVGQGVEIQFDPAPQLPQVRADAGMIEQVLMNLVLNSRDAMPDGGQLRIETAAVAVDAEAARKKPDASPGQYARLSVLDAGCGIPPENMTRIFEPFFTTKEVGKGTGLGLATVYGIVAQHRGWVDVESRVGHGTAIHVLLPALAALQPAAVTPPAPDRVAGGAETILLVEDDAPLRSLARAALQRFGYRVMEASSGVSALKMWQVRQSEIQLLVTDIVMPEGLTGLDLAGKLRADRPALPVLFTSGYSTDFFKTDTVLREGNNFLQKPYKPEDLARAVRACLDALG
jgi:signal transduction histidine kinase/CheY-like chemotaxis protein